MNPGIIMPLVMVCLLSSGTDLPASGPVSAEMQCSPGVGPWLNSNGICADPDGSISASAPESSLLLLLPPHNSWMAAKAKSPAVDNPDGLSKNPGNKTIVYFFRGEGCPHCDEEKTFLDSLKRDLPALEIREYEVWYHRENAGLLAALLRAHGVLFSGVPVTFVGSRLFTGFTVQTSSSMEKVIKDCLSVACDDPAEGFGVAEQVGRERSLAAAKSATDGGTYTDTTGAIPLPGALDTGTSSLPVLTLVIAGMDSFNPCAFFVLFSLLGLLVHARSRNKMLLIGGVFVFFSGFIYFLFMAAWLNLFLIMGRMAVITVIAGCISLVIAGINIKDFFLYKRGISLTIHDSARLKLFERMRKLLHSTSLVSLLIGTTVLAVVANSYELLCTAGFPMLFTRILTLHKLSPVAYYLYLLLYNLVYTLPLFIIVLGFTLTLGKRQLSEWQGRVLKLVSGAMMLGLGGVLLLNPALLNNLTVSFTILLTALGVSLLVATVTRKLWK